MGDDAGLEAVAFTLIVDDIVLPHGETAMAQLGGGGSQTLFGYQLTCGGEAKLGLAAGVGSDLPSSCQALLLSLGADAAGLLLHTRPTPRAWQVFEEDGRRTQVWRGKNDPTDELYSMLLPRWESLPPHFQRCTNYHLGVHPLHPPLELMSQLRAAAHARGGTLSVETYTAAEQPATLEQVAQLVSACDIFSPNELEAESMLGLHAGSATGAEGVAYAFSLAEQLIAAAGDSKLPQVVVIRRGPQGVVAMQRSSGRRVQVPAVAGLCVRDVTGCGNAFCGGFLAAWHRQEHDLLEACLAGTVAAAAVAEVVGLPQPPVSKLVAHAHARIAALRPYTMDTTVSTRFVHGAEAEVPNASIATATASGIGGGVSAHVGLHTVGSVRARGGQCDKAASVSATAWKGAGSAGMHHHLTPHLRLNHRVGTRAAAHALTSRDEHNNRNRSAHATAVHSRTACTAQHGKRGSASAWRCTHNSFDVLSTSGVMAGALHRPLARQCVAALSSHARTVLHPSVR